MKINIIIDSDKIIIIELTSGSKFCRFQCTTFYDIFAALKLGSTRHITPSHTSRCFPEWQLSTVRSKHCCEASKTSRTISRANSPTTVTSNSRNTFLPILWRSSLAKMKRFCSVLSFKNCQIVFRLASASNRTREAMPAPPATSLTMSLLPIRYGRPALNSHRSLSTLSRPITEQSQNIDTGFSQHQKHNPTSHY